MPDSRLGAGNLASRIDELFRTARRPDGRRYTYEQVARELERRSGLVVSASYLWRLRSGKSNNPTLNHIQALAAFFRVCPQYFFGDDTRPLAQDQQLEDALRDPRVRDIAVELRGLSASSLDAIASMAASARRIEGLPVASSSSVGDNR
jgi:transcriptional regulator with XRE-family HTH domain